VDLFQNPQKNHLFLSIFLFPWEEQAMDRFDIPFQPHPLISGGIAQKVVASQFSGEFTLHPRIQHRVSLRDNCLLLLLELPAPVPGRPIVLLAHGMGGCSESAYIRRISDKLFRLGYHIFQMNHRGSGPGIGLSNSLWNGGSSADFASVVDYIVKLYPGQPLLLAGFSLSGNVLLKYLGEGRSIPSSVFAALAVNPPVDLEVSSRAISEGPWSRVFNGYYLSLMHRQARAMKECHREAYSPTGNAKTIYEFDVEYTAPAAGYRDVDEYYSLCSSKRFLEHITVPTTLLCSKDDPFVPPKVFEDARMSLCMNFVDPDFGGHMGYIGKSRLPTGDHRWMDYICVEWAKSNFPNIQTSENYPAMAV